MPLPSAAGIGCHDAGIAAAMDGTIERASAAAIPPTILIKSFDAAGAERGIRGRSTVGRDRVLNERRSCAV